MTSYDSYLLILQFQAKIVRLNGSAFQNFAADIFKITFDDFQKVKPDGRKGDEGNDGFREDSGTYYQIYSPEDPSSKKKKAAIKFKEDFNKIISGRWSFVTPIKAYYFVFNDHFNGATQDLLLAKAELKEKWPKIDFSLIGADDLQKIVLGLDEFRLKSLGFTTEGSQIGAIYRESIEMVKILLNREELDSVKLMFKSIDIISQSVQNQIDLVEIELLKIKLLIKEEQVSTAKDKLNQLIKNSPLDTRAYIYLADIIEREGNKEGFLTLIEKAKRIDVNNDYVRFGQLLKDIKAGENENVNIPTIEEISGYTEMHSEFYRLCGSWFLGAKEFESATLYLEKSISEDYSNLLNHIAKLQLLFYRCNSCSDRSERKIAAEVVFNHINSIKDEFLPFHGTAIRSRIIVELIQLQVESILDEGDSTRIDVQKLLSGVLGCSFDRQIEEIIASILAIGSLNDHLLNDLQKYILKAEKPIQAHFANMLLMHFNVTHQPLAATILFFKMTGNTNLVSVLESIGSESEETTIELLNNDQQLALILASTLEGFISLRQKIIDQILGSDHKHANFLQFMLLVEEDKVDLAYDMIDRIDLSSMKSLQLFQIEEVVHRKQAWDTEIEILNRLLSIEIAETKRFSLKIRLFTAYGRLKNYIKAIELGKELLEVNGDEKFLDNIKTEYLLRDTLFAMISRFDIKPDLIQEAKNLLEKYEPIESSFEFKMGIKAAILIACEELSSALRTMVSACSNNNWLEPGRIEFLFKFALELEKRFGFTLEPDKIIEDGNFVKLSFNNDWFLVGDGASLNAKKIAASNPLYSKLLNKKLGDMIEIKYEYSSKLDDGLVEYIFPIEKYILFRVVQEFNQLIDYSNIPGFTKIETPIGENNIDLTYLKKFMESSESESKAFFEMYMNGSVPLALLAIVEGTLLTAIGKINRAKKGFINGNSGTIAEYDRQKKLVREIINQNKSFYIDATSVFFIARLGIFSEITDLLLNARIPQSVIDFSLRLVREYSATDSRVGYLAYLDGIITFSEVDKGFETWLRDQIVAIIEFFESSPHNIEAISPAKKIESVAESRVLPELCDACILAQMNDLPLMTEDYLYVSFNNAETGKKAPEFFSIFVFLRVLFEDSYISKDSFYNSFHLLAKYRYKFLHLDPDDLEKVVFGTDKIVAVTPKELQKLNLNLILSQEYGTNFWQAYLIIARVILKLLQDPSIIETVLRDIFSEIMEGLPSDSDRYLIGRLIIDGCSKILSENTTPTGIKLERHNMDIKITAMRDVLQLYKHTRKLF